MGCPVCGRASVVQKALKSKFQKQDIQDLLLRMKEQRRKDVELLHKKQPEISETDKESARK